MTDLDRFKTKLLDFVERTGVSRSELGRNACNDASFVSDFIEGREPRFSTIAKVEAWMELYDRDSDAALGKSKPRSCPPEQSKVA